MEKSRRLSEREAADYIGVSASTLAKWRMRDGAGPAFFKLRRRVLYDTQIIKAWLDKNRRTSTSQAM